MFERRFRKADFYAARDRLRQQVGWALLTAYNDSGYTLRQIAKRLRKPQSWVASRLFTSRDMSLRELAELGWAMGRPAKFEVYDSRKITPRGLAYRPAVWLKVDTSTSIYALGQAWDNEERLAA